jgi:hypothetical protein
VRHTWYRLDGTDPADWKWTPFPTPRYRFDSAAGTHRVRYAGQTQRGAMRERFDEVGRVISAGDLDAHLVELSGKVNVLDLRSERTLDALGLDDHINTSRAPEVWAACQRLADLAVGWFGERLGGIVYRSRTTPQTSANLAFFGPGGLTCRSLGRLGDQDGLLAACVHDGFTIEGW